MQYTRWACNELVLSQLLYSTSHQCLDALVMANEGLNWACVYIQEQVAQKLNLGLVMVSPLH